VIGGIVMSAWGGFKRQVHGVLLGWILASLFGMILFGMGQTLPIWLVAIAVGSLFVPMINSSNQAIWQAKVAPDVQGRVFSARRLIAWFASPIAPMIAGGLADLVFEPAMRAHTGFSNLFGGLAGTGPGAGMSLLMVFCGIGVVLVGISGYFIPAIRNAESLLPDHDTLPLAE
jgi:MFS transporter, DHA3 family, macrolide efflux protein